MYGKALRCLKTCALTITGTHVQYHTPPDKRKKKQKKKRKKKKQNKKTKKKKKKKKRKNKQKKKKKKKQKKPKKHFAHHGILRYFIGVICVYCIYPNNRIPQLSSYHTCPKIWTFHCLLIFSKQNEWHTV